MSTAVKHVILVVILLFLVQCALSRNLISYEEMRSDSQLFADKIIAHVDGLDYTIIPSNEYGCFMLLDQRDYDGNGTIDALIKILKGCGSSGNTNSLLIITMNDIGYFNISDIVGTSCHDPILEEKDGKVILSFIDEIEDSDYCEIEVYKKRFIYDGMKLNCIEDSRKCELLATKEFRSKEFLNDDKWGEKLIQFDIDGDNKLDTIRFKYWDRWGRMNWTIDCSSHGHIDGEYACKRFGILSVSTNGMRDLVMDSDEILIWKDGRYANANTQMLDSKK